MPVKVNYTTKIIKQCYHYDDEETGKPYFKEEAIGVSFPKVLYAENEDTAYNLISKWNSDPYYEYLLVDIEKIIHDEIPRSVFFHETVHFGKRMDMEN